MRIAFILDSFPALSETFILNQITGLLNLGHELDIYADNAEDDRKVHSDVERYGLLSRTYYWQMPMNKFWRVFKALGLLILKFPKNPLVILRSFNVFKYGKYALSLRLFYVCLPFLSQNHYDIIHCHMGRNGNLGVLLREIEAIGGKIVTTFHGHDIRLGLRHGGNIYAHLRTKGDCFISISRYNHGHLQQFGFNPGKIFNHNVGIEINKFQFRWSKETTLAREKRVVKIVSVARLVEEKGLEYGIKSINELLKNRPRLLLEYNIIGHGSLEEQLKALVASLGLADVVRFLGEKNQTEVTRRLQDSDIFLLPSIAEASPVVLMEAQAVGLPVVATKVGSVADIVLDGKSGFLVRDKDPLAIARKLEYLIEHPEVWPKMGGIGRKFIEEHYDVDKLNSHLVEIYQKILDGRFS